MFNLRTPSLKRVWMPLAAFLVAGLAGTAVAMRPVDDVKPSLDQQLERHGIQRGTALEKLVRQNQEFELLSPEERKDTGRVPAWLKIYWRKNHPEAEYLPNDPTGGYPHAIKEVLEWMLSHQDLRPGYPEPMSPPEWYQLETADEPIAGLVYGEPGLNATAGTNQRVSGAQTSPRSESDIRLNYWNPNYVIAGSNNISASGFQAQFWSTDGGATWGQTTLPNPQSDGSNSDPTVDWQSSSVAWATTMGVTGSTLRLRAYKSTDYGKTWAYDGTPSGTQTNVDKQMMWIDHSSTSSYKDNIYLIWHNGTPVYMSRRNSTGWLASPVKVSGTETTGTGIGSDVKTNSYGDVFGMWPDTGSRGLYVVKSTNGGTSYGTPVKLATTYDSYDIGIPSFNGRRLLIYVSAGAYRTATKNNVYAAWTDLSGETGCTAASNEPGSSTTSACKTRIWFARSTNGGTTWGTPVKINNQSGKNDQFNQWLAVDETNGKIGIIYYDTVADTNRKKTHVYYQSSTDDGATWSTALQVTTAQTDETVSGADSGNQYGDYNSLSGYAGVFFPSWTDRRNAGKEEIWTAKVTDGGTAPTTYSIAGSAGTASATVTAGSSTVTADASGNFTFTGLSAGTYTVTPSKSGCTFTPASRSVTVGPNATGITFTASCSTPVYSISGSAGTASATVTAGSTSVTADASGNYTVSNLVAGTYTVTPSKTGCTFTPTSRSVTVGPNATGITFTASCGGGGTTTQLFANAGFESGATSWTGTSGVITNSTNRTPRTGSYYAWLNGYGKTSTEYLYQQVTIPSTATAATLNFYLKVDTAETTTSTAYDKLTVTVRNSSNTVLATLATYSNLNKGTSYVLKSFNLLAYKGQTVRIYFNGTEDSSLQTSFLLDDTSLNVTTP